jgi:hypothetical protein
MAVMGYHIGIGIAGVYGRLEYFYTLFGKLGPFQAPYQFFCFAGKHRTADDFDSSSALGLLYVIF